MRCRGRVVLRLRGNRGLDHSQLPIFADARRLERLRFQLELWRPLAQFRSHLLWRARSLLEWAKRRQILLHSVKEEVTTVRTRRDKRKGKLTSILDIHLLVTVIDVSIGCSRNGNCRLRLQLWHRGLRYRQVSTRKIYILRRLDRTALYSRFRPRLGGYRGRRSRLSSTGDRVDGGDAGILGSNCFTFGTPFGEGEFDRRW